jgi:hypothetical protein
MADLQARSAADHIATLDYCRPAMQRLPALSSAKLVILHADATLGALPPKLHEFARLGRR